MLLLLRFADVRLPTDVAFSFRHLNRCFCRCCSLRWCGVTFSSVACLRWVRCCFLPCAALHSLGRLRAFVCAGAWARRVFPRLRLVRLYYRIFYGERLPGIPARARFTCVGVIDIFSCGTRSAFAGVGWVPVRSLLPAGGVERRGWTLRTVCFFVAGRVNPFAFVRNVRSERVSWVRHLLLNRRVAELCILSIAVPVLLLC